jgi:hypothetical protein
MNCNIKEKYRGGTDLIGERPIPEFLTNHKIKEVISILDERIYQQFREPYTEEARAICNFINSDEIGNDELMYTNTIKHRRDWTEAFIRHFILNRDMSVDDKLENYKSISAVNSFSGAYFSQIKSLDYLTCYIAGTTDYKIGYASHLFDQKGQDITDTSKNSNLPPYARSAPYNPYQQDSVDVGSYLIASMNLRSKPLRDEIIAEQEEWRKDKQDFKMTLPQAVDHTRRFCKLWIQEEWLNKPKTHVILLKRTTSTSLNNTVPKYIDSITSTAWAESGGFDCDKTVTLFLTLANKHAICLQDIADSNENEYILVPGSKVGDLYDITSMKERLSTKKIYDRSKDPLKPNYMWSFMGIERCRDGKPHQIGITTISGMDPVQQQTSSGGASEENILSTMTHIENILYLRYYQNQQLIELPTTSPELLISGIYKFILHNQQYLEKRYKISINNNVRLSIEKVLRVFQVNLKNPTIEEILTKLDIFEKEGKQRERKQKPMRYENTKIGYGNECTTQTVKDCVGKEDPISLEPISDSNATCFRGRCYEKEPLSRWLKEHNTDPMTRVVIY